MSTIGILEAKANLSRLVDRVASGEEIVVTRHGRALARLVAPAPQPASDAQATQAWIDKLRAYRRGLDRGARPGSTLQELIAAGRR